MVVEVGIAVVVLGLVVAVGVSSGGSDGSSFNRGGSRFGMLVAVIV